MIEITPPGVLFSLTLRIFVPSTRLTVVPSLPAFLLKLEGMKIRCAFSLTWVLLTDMFLSGSEPPFCKDKIAVPPPAWNSWVWIIAFP